MNIFIVVRTLYEFGFADGKLSYKRASVKISPQQQLGLFAWPQIHGVLQKLL